MDWQPIETAPKDGTRILVYAPNEGCGVAEMNTLGRATCAWGDYDWVDQGGDMVMLKEVTPTHWMPLPLPPAP